MIIENPPFISVIIPVLNGEQFIGGCLKSIFELAYPRHRYEVIVVDNGSTDKTLEISREYDVRVMLLPEATIAALRNYGAKNSRGDILAFVDSDCLVSRMWLNNAAPYFANSRIAMVGSLCKITDENTWVGKAWDACLRRRRLRGETTRLGSGNMLIRRTSFEEMRGFDETLVTGEDDDLCYRTIKAGYLIYSDPGIEVYHLGEYRTLSRFFQKEIWRGYESFSLFLKAKGRINLKVTIYAMYYLLAMISIFFSMIAVCIFQASLFVLFSSLVLLTALPTWLAAMTAIRSKQWNYLFPFAILYLTFGVARAIALLRIKSL